MREELKLKANKKNVIQDCLRKNLKTILNPHHKVLAFFPEKMSVQDPSVSVFNSSF